MKAQCPAVAQLVGGQGLAGKTFDVEAFNLSVVFPDA